MIENGTDNDLCLRVELKLHPIEIFWVETKTQIVAQKNMVISQKHKKEKNHQILESKTQFKQTNQDSIAKNKINKNWIK